MATFRGVGVRQTAAGIGTQPAEARKSLAGLLVPSSVVGARVGILAAPGNPLRVSGTAGWEYTVNAGHLASSRSDSDGSTMPGLDGTTLTTAVAAAPGSGSRWDLIYLVQHDIDAGDADASAVLGVVSGVASGSPVKPTVPAGAVTLAESLVAAGATSTSHASVTITNVLPKTVARGGVLPVATKTELDAITGYEGMRAVVTTGATAGREWEWRSGGWVWPKAAQGVLGTASRTTLAGPENGNVPVPVAGTSIVVAVDSPGRRLRGTLTGTAVWDNGSTTVALVIIRMDGVQMGRALVTVATSGLAASFTLIGEVTPAAGSHTFDVAFCDGTGVPGGVSLPADATNPLHLTIEDIGAA